MRPWTCPAAWAREVLAKYTADEMLGFLMDLNFIVAEAGL